LITRLLLPVSVTPPTHESRVGSTFDLDSPQYAFFYDRVKVHCWFEEAGLEQIRPAAPDSGVSFIATKPSAEATDWHGDAGAHELQSVRSR
jgi:hypothetical protein